MAKAKTKKAEDKGVKKTPEQLELEQKHQCLKELNEVLNKYNMALIPTFSLNPVKNEETEEKSD